MQRDEILLIKEMNWPILLIPTCRQIVLHIYAPYFYRTKLLSTVFFHFVVGARYRIEIVLTPKQGFNNNKGVDGKQLKAKSLW